MTRSVLIRFAGSKRQGTNATLAPNQRLHPQTAHAAADAICSSTRDRCKRFARHPLLRPTTRKADCSSDRDPAISPAERYQLLQYISHDRNGSVNLSKDLQTRTLVAVKTVIHADASTAPSEVRILQHLGQHENVIQLFDYFEHPCKADWTRIVFEHCEIGDLQNYLREMGTATPPEPFLWHVLSEVGRGLAHIHSFQIVHGDIKLSNVLMRHPPRLSCDSQLDHPHFPVLKIADFGNAVLRPRHDIPRSHLSTWSCCAPESVQYFGPATDVWALGCMLHQLAHRKFPRIPTTDGGQQTGGEENNNESSDFSNDLGTFRTFLRTHTVVPTPLNRPTARSMPRSRLLNYFMMRALELDHNKRITSKELTRYLPTLTDLICHIVPLNKYDPVTYMSTKRYRPILARFNDGNGTTDSSVVRDVFCSFVHHAVKYAKSYLLLHIVKLLPLLDPADEAVANDLLTKMIGPPSAFR